MQLITVLYSQMAPSVNKPQAIDLAQNTIECQATEQITTLS